MTQPADVPDGNPLHPPAEEPVPGSLVSTGPAGNSPGGPGPAAESAGGPHEPDVSVLVDEPATDASADAAATPGTETGSAAAGRRRPRIPGWLEFPLLIGIALLVAFLLKTFIVQAFYIPSGSMENTLQVGDRVLVNKVVYHLRPIERGDIIVFDGAGIFGSEFEPAEPTGPFGAIGSFIGSFFGFAPPGESDYIKRVIGVGGDRVVCCDDKGRITVNGVALQERSYIYRSNPPSRQKFDVIVPEGKLWVMGDHRSASADSRAHMGDPGGGFVPESRVVGRAFAVVWPISNAQFLEIPATFEQPDLVNSP